MNFRNGVDVLHDSLQYIRHNVTHGGTPTKPHINWVAQDSMNSRVHQVDAEWTTEPMVIIKR